MIEKRFTPTVSMFFRASREILHSNKSVLWFYGFFLGMPIFLIGLFILTGKGSSHEVVPGISAWAFFGLCAFYVFGLTPALQYWEVRKSVLSNPSANQEQVYAISEEGVRNFGRGIDVSLGWDKITRIRVSKHFLLLFISKKVAYFIPRDLLSEQEIEEINTWRSQKT
ncbi:MAG: YcxB family protein [Gammaproteobacteria bacterium]|nr:YcxB family protein [Gammaproteobacteria bacterium]